MTPVIGGSRMLNERYPRHTLPHPVVSGLAFAMVSSKESPRQRISTTAVVILSFVLVISFLLPTTTFYSVHLQTFQTTKILYNTMVEHVNDTIVTGPAVVEIIPDQKDEDAASSYQRYLTLADPSTESLRQWLNASLQPGGNTKYYDAPDSPSTIVYKACCGLGHRLTRLEDAAHVALLYDAALEVTWSDCGSDTFQQMFGTEPLRLSEKRSQGFHWTFSNDVPQCYGISDRTLCPSILDGKVLASARMYQELLDRYLQRNTVQEFIETHFGKDTDLTSIGMHIRAGNNETGDFTRKQRQITDMNAFVKTNADRIRGMIGSSKAVLFIATDTPSYVQAFRNELNDTMAVVELQQVRAKEGTGVLFGEHGAPKPTGEECLEGWHAALQDMMILASTDIVFASTYSSFTRTMPRVLALTRPNRRVNQSYCENWKDSSKMQCYASMDEFNANPPPMK